MSARTHTMLFERDDETEVVIKYRLNPYDPGVLSGPAEQCYPPEGGDIADWEVDGGGELTEAEIERMVREIYANQPDDDDDRADWLYEQARDERL
jgi:hypothetical protein